MTLYLVLVYDVDERRYVVHSDTDDEIDAYLTCAECNGIIRTIQVDHAKELETFGHARKTIHDTIRTEHS